jgi:hypothetical protein
VSDCVVITYMGRQMVWQIRWGRNPSLQESTQAVRSEGHRCADDEDASGDRGFVPGVAGVLAYDTDR